MSIIYILILAIIIILLLKNKSNNRNTRHYKRIKSASEIEKENKIRAMVEQAIQNNKKLFIGYKSSYGYSGEEYTERVIIPKTISAGSELNQSNPLEKGEWIDEEYYLFAYCELRDEERHFRIDRIQSIKIIE